MAGSLSLICSMLIESMMERLARLGRCDTIGVVLSVKCWSEALRLQPTERIERMEGRLE